MRKFYLYLLFGLLACFLASPVLAQEKISDYQVDISIDQNTAVVVREQINYDFGTLSKHGIFRKIPVNYHGGNQDFSLNVQVVNVSDEQNKIYKYTSYQEGDYLVIKIGDAQQYVSGQKKYFITYLVQGSVLFFENYDEFYWNVIGSDWEITIDQASLSLKLPKQAITSQSIFKCWSGAYGSRDNCQTLSTNNTDDQFSVVLAKQNNLLPKQAMTILVQVPKGLFDEVAATNLVKKSVPKTIGTLGSNWWFALPFLTLFFTFRWWYKKGRDPKGRGNIIVEYDVPHDLRPAEVGAIVYEKFEDKFLTAEIIYLASMGYLKIIRQPKAGFIKREDFILEKVKASDNALKIYQQELFEYLFAQADKKQQVKISDFKNDFYKFVEKWRNKLWELLRVEKYYTNNVPISSMSLAVVAYMLIFAALPALFIFGLRCVIGLGISALVVAVFSRFMPQKSNTGVLTKEYLLGLKEYLEVAEKDRLKFHNAPDKDPQTFEKLLPYAIVFGVENQWAEKFKDIYKVSPTWYSDPSLANFNSVLFISSIHNFTSSANYNLAGPSAGAGGFGGGGGFSGGGFGGGGGGSW